MTNKLSSTMSTYAKWLITNYQAITKINLSTPSLRLVSLEGDRTSNTLKFVVQISGKNIFPRLSENDLSSQSILMNFSRSDQEIIRQYLPLKENEITKHISARTYDRNCKKFIYTVKTLDQTRKIWKSEIIKDISSLSSMVDKFDGMDAYLIGLETKNQIDLKNPTIQ